jgi:hypothetical protein
MTDDLLQAVRDLPKVARYLHVPAQSGCDEVLKRMKRMYSVALYDEMLARIRATVPDCAVSSDFIVGFCGETEASFEKTVGLVERARFKNSFIFKYSPRRGTKADALFADDVPEEVKRRRNNELLAVQTAISQADNRPLIGRTLPVLVEGPSKAAARRDGHAAGFGSESELRSRADRPDDRPDPLRPDRRLRGARAAGRADPARRDPGRQRRDPIRPGGDDRGGDIVGVGAKPMVGRLEDVLPRWAEAVGVDPGLLPGPCALREPFGTGAGPCRPPADPRRVAAWEHATGSPCPGGCGPGCCCPTASTTTGP